MDKRLQYFDIAKGIAIYSVILVHLNTFCGWNSNLLFYIIHSYFMPLFFFISGYFCYKQGIFDYSLYLRKKIKQLIVPYFTSCLFICFVYSYLFDVNLLDRYLFDSSKGGFWFLLTLFIFQLIYVCLKRFISKFSNKNLYLILLILIWLLICTLNVFVENDILYLFSLPELRRFFPAFALGLLIRIYDINIIGKKVMSLSGIIYLLILVMGYDDKTYIGFLFWLLSSSLASIFILNVSFLFVERIRRFAIYGKYSLGIYIYHYLFIYLLKYYLNIESFNNSTSIYNFIICVSFFLLAYVIIELSTFLVQLTEKTKLKFLIGL